MNIKEQRKLVQDIDKKEQKTITLNDKFRFECTKCGQCCFNNSVIVNCYDLIRLRHALKLTTKEILGNRLLSFHIGPSSGLPILTINFDLFDKSKKCPFLYPAISLRDLQEANPIWKDPKELKKALINNPTGPLGIIRDLKYWICRVHKDRPIICRFFPSGRIKKVDRKKQTEETIWIFQDKGDCPGLQSNKEQKLSDFLTEAEFYHFDEGSAKYQHILESLTKSGFMARTKDNKKENPIWDADSPVLLFIANVLYNFDSIAYFSKDKRVLGTIYNKIVSHEDCMYVLEKISQLIDFVIKSYNDPSLRLELINKFGIMKAKGGDNEQKN